MIDLRKTLRGASDALGKKKIPHALIGGFALAVHGVHRATRDIDFLADGSRTNEIVDVLTEAGFALIQQNAEVLHFSGIGFVDILLANRPASVQMLKDAISNANLQVHVLRAEDIIGLKIQAYKNDPS